jgi:translation initiation factor IF-2
MNDASQVRINELARELEVKAKAIIDLLPGFGVTEKKTHSSSITVEVAEKVRERLKYEADAEARAESERAAKEAAAKSAQRRPAPAASSAHVPPIVAKPVPPVAPAPVAAAPSAAVVPPAVRPPAPAPVMSGAPAAAPPVAKPSAPPSTAAPSSIAPTAPAPRPPAPMAPPSASPSAQPTAQAPRPAAPGGQQPGPRPVAPGQPSSGPRPGTAISQQPGARPPQGVRPQQPGAQAGLRSVTPGQPLRAGQPVPPARPPMPTRMGNRGPVPGTTPGSQQRQSGPRPGQPMRPQGQGGQGGNRPHTQRPSGPGGPGGSGQGGPGGPGRSFGQRPGAVPMGSRPGPRTPGRPAMLPPFPEKMSPKAEPGKPLYTRKPTQRQRPTADKREIEGERKLHPTRQRPGAGGRGVAVPVAPPEPRAPRDITLTEGITIRELAEKLDIRAKDLLKTLLDRGVFASINQALDVETATDLAQSFNGVVSVVSFEEEMVLEVAQEETKENLKPRPPVVTVMGHVDHGKTSLLDAIRTEDVAAGEAGGITQHIGAYKVQVGERAVVFVDTPGHEAFTRMRARGAKVTDIVVLVVAADDGVMPQTREAIDHAKAANVPIIVAINKIDKPEAQPERVKRQLSELALMPAEWGGDTEFVEVSAKQKKNLDKLLEIILLVADLRELKANPDAPAAGTVLESRVDRGRGPVATILVQNGTLQIGDFFIAGSVFGKVRALFDEHGRPVKNAPPSTPVEVLGLQGVPEAGDHFQVTDEAKARHVVEYRQGKQRDAALRASSGGRITLDQLHEQLKSGEVKELPIVIKADVQGSAEVLGEMLPKLSTDLVKLKIISTGVGTVTENDVLFASASGAIIIAFGVRPDRKALDLAQQEKVDIRTHKIIYEVSDEIKKAMDGLLEPVLQETYLGRAEVRNVFRIKGSGSVAGCYVVDGIMKRDAQARVVREGVVVYTSKLSSLKRFKDDASEVRTGFECGLGISNFNDVKIGDIIECFQVVKLSAAEAAAQGSTASAGRK